MWAEVGSLYYSLQEYIHSDQLNHAASEPSSEYLVQLGEVLRKLHGIEISETLRTDVFAESLHPAIASDARASLESVLTYTGDDNSIKSVQHTIVTRRENIEQLFTNLSKLGDELVKLGESQVIVHGDMHFGNIIEPRNDHIYLIDWDHAKLSLPEMDLMFFTDDQITHISTGYGRDLLTNRAAIQYHRNYLLVRALDFFLAKLLTSNDKHREDLATSFNEIYNLSPYFRRALQTY